MVPEAEFWQNQPRMQNASEAGAETSISAPSNPSTLPVPSDPAGRAGSPSQAKPVASREIGGPPGPEPTRYGDWEKKGRCIDF